MFRAQAFDACGFCFNKKFRLGFPVISLAIKDDCKIAVAFLDFNLLCDFARQWVITKNLLKEFDEIHYSVGFIGVAFTRSLEHISKLLQLRQD